MKHSIVTRLFASHRSILHGLALLGAAALLVAPRPGRADLYVLRTFPGVATSYGLSTNGLITGVTGAGHAYTFDGTNFNDYGSPSFGTNSIGFDVNTSGNVVGYTTTSAGNPLALYGVAANSWYYLPSPWGGNKSLATGVSDRLDVYNHLIGDWCGYGTDPTDTTFHAWGFDSATETYARFPEPSGTTSSFAQKVANNGAIVGYYDGSDTPGGTNGFYWNQDTGTVLSSGTLPGGAFSSINGIDSAGNLACGYADDSSGHRLAVIWNFASLTALPLSDPNYPYTDQVFGVRSNGRTVGQGHSAATNTYVAHLWDVGVNEDLNTVTVNSNGSKPTITLESAGNINEAGQIVCYAQDSSGNRAVRLDPFGPTGIFINGAPKHGKPVKGSLFLNIPAPATTTVTILSSNHVALPDFTATVKKGQTIANFTSTKLSKTSMGQSLTLTASDTGMTATSSTIVIK